MPLRVVRGKGDDVQIAGIDYVCIIVTRATLVGTRLSIRLAANKGKVASSFLAVGPESTLYESLAAVASHSIANFMPPLPLVWRRILKHLLSTVTLRGNYLS